jgi:hypothetical protein
MKLGTTKKRNEIRERLKNLRLEEYEELMLDLADELAHNRSCMEVSKDPSKEGKSQEEHDIWFEYYLHFIKLILY